MKQIESVQSSRLMGLTAGTKLGPYEILSPLGEGGMGEVYRARDTKLAREVALKVLPEAFAADAERMGRFEREAKVLASLNHPNIASIYGFEDSAGVYALVMELVEGETLEEMIAGGPTQSRISSGRGKSGSGATGTSQSAQEGSETVGMVTPAPRKTIPLDEALPIAKQICEGLEYAHERGIVHRDLKPANVKITPEGTVKLLDFGLAKALEGDGGTAGDVSTSPTISRLATQAGIILGTAAYMSPEQAKGKSVDRRADIWAFGCVLNEMLSGKKAFDGETISDVLAAVIRAEPDWNALPTGTPTVVEKLLRRCLTKDPKQRLQAIGEARIAIEKAQSGESDGGVGLPPPPTEEAPGHLSRPRRVLPWALVGLVGVAFLLTLAMLWRGPQSAPQAPAVLSLAIPSSQQLNVANGPALVISPDGSRIAYVSQAGGKSQIYVRELDKVQATPLEGAEGNSLFFSPDGQWIGFFGQGKLQKVSVFGGAPVALCDVSGPRGAWWGEDGTIVFTPSYTSPLERVSAAGGQPHPLTHFDQSRKEVTHRWPQILPGGKEVLFTASADDNDYSHADIEAASLSTGQAKVLVENAFFGRYLASGYLTYVSGGTLFAVPFDAKNLKVTGTAMPMIQDISADLTNGSAQFSVSANGTAVYLTGKMLGSQVTVAMVDRNGKATPLVKQPGDYYAPRFSPDGRQLALQVGTGNTWIYDLARQTMTPLTFRPAACLDPVWTPDGKRIVCLQVSTTVGGITLSWIPSNGTGSLQPLTSPSPLTSMPNSWLPDGKVLAFIRLRQKSGNCCEIWTLPIQSNGKPGEAKPFLGQDSSRFFVFPAFSPDGHWLAYRSNESGTSQVYVVPYPGPGGKRQISIAGGGFPEWSRTGHELFFERRGNPSTMLSVSYSVQGNSFQAGTPRVLFQGGFVPRGQYSDYDVAPDGKHFAVVEPAGGQSAELPSPTVALNWFSRVRKLVSAGQRNSGK